uniref:Uncharacterized protein n=1 Tax=Aegilops tauschii TaxID=37682 RepID=M8BNA4_AEGTA
MKLHMTNHVLQGGAFRKGTTPECRHRPIQRPEFPRSRMTGNESRDDAFKKGTIFAAAGIGKRTTSEEKISKLKEDIEKIQASEAEIKALSFNYAAMLKEKEVIQKNGPHPLPVHYKGDALVEERAYFASKQASLENEIKQLKQQLRCYSNKEDDTTRRLEDENKRNEFLQQQLNELKVDKEMVATTMEELHKELSEKKAELRCLQDELSTRDNERASDGSLQSLRSMVMALQKENSDLKIAKGSLYEELVNMESTTQKVDNSTSDVDNFSDVEKVQIFEVKL